MSASTSVSCDWPDCAALFDRRYADTSERQEVEAAIDAGWVREWDDDGAPYDLCPQHRDGADR